MATDNQTLLNLIEVKKMTAQQICDKCKFTMGTLRRRFAVLVMNERKFIDVPGLFDPDNVAELKKGGIVFSAKKLTALGCEFEIGSKFNIDIDKKKIVLTVN